MDAQTLQTIRGIHDSPTRAAIAVTGGGAQAVAWLLGVPGASRTILEALAPYAARALVEFIGERPERMASVETAELMARAAHRRARALAEYGAPVVGVGCAASLATDRPKQGEHRVHVALCGEASVITYSVRLKKGARQRREEDAVASALVVRALAEGAQTRCAIRLALLDGECLEIGGHGDPVSLLAAGAIQTALVGRDGAMTANGRPHGAVLSGSFNPLHEGHLALAAAASEIAGAPVAAELSVVNVDKRPLSASAARERLAQFAGMMDVALTRAATFEEKARALPGVQFVIGYDTLERLLAPKYYGGSRERVMEALAIIRQAGCGFIVAGRTYGGRFHAMEEATIPPEFADMFTAIPESRFRRDISSTALRAEDAEGGEGHGV